MVASSSVRVLVVGVALAAVSAAAAARLALRPPSVDPAAVVAAPRAGHAVLIMNPWSGGGKVEKFELERLCRERGIEPIVLYKGSDLLALAEDAVARGADVIGMAGRRRVTGARGLGGEPARHPDGGDPGGHPQPLRARPRHGPGRRRRARSTPTTTASTGGSTSRRSTGGSSSTTRRWGCTPGSCSRDEYRDAKMRTAAETLPDLIGPAAVPLDLRFTLPSGEQATSANLVLVSNNPYQLSHLRGASTRPRLDTGTARRRLGAGARRRGRREVRRAGGCRAGLPVLGLERVDRHGVRGDLGRAGRGRRRRRGAHHGPAAALRHPARSPGPCGRPGRCCPARWLHRPCTSCRPTRWGRCGTPPWAGRWWPDERHRAGPSGRPRSSRSRSGWPGGSTNGPLQGTRSPGTPRGSSTGWAATTGRSYVAVARLSTPALDAPLSRLSHFANHSKPWFLTAAALALFGGRTGRRAAMNGVAGHRGRLARREPADEAGRQPRPTRPRGPCGAGGSLGADADVDVVPVRPLGVGPGVRGRRR